MHTVYIIEARSLVAKDRNGLSDPFCELHCVGPNIHLGKGGRHRKTKVIQKTLMRACVCYVTNVNLRRACCTRLR